MHEAVLGVGIVLPHRRRGALVQRLLERRIGPRLGDVVVAGIPGDEATVKTFSRKRSKVVLTPSNAPYSPIELDPADVTIYGKVVTVLRCL